MSKEIMKIAQDLETVKIQSPLPSRLLHGFPHSVLFYFLQIILRILRNAEVGRFVPNGSKPYFEITLLSLTGVY